MIDPELLSETLTNARKVLLAERNAAGHWTGELSTSALSTATALVALGSANELHHRDHVTGACRWLVAHQNEDGGWGDTVKSFSNLSTTLLCWSALTRFDGDPAREAVVRASHWIRDHVGSLDPALIAETVKARYGKDRTFSVPILMLCAICGTLGPRGWDQVMQMPYQLAAFPRSWFAALRLPVVSYALPALIAIGYAKSRNTIARFRTAIPDPLWPRLSKLLASIQPASGGFLEAAPLTSFVTMALVSAGERDHPVVRRGVSFLLDTVRPDGSWPIDTNLATWATTLAVKALGVSGAGRNGEPTLFEGHGEVKRWLLDQQYRERHPFTDAAPGGWAWTDLSGGVPDADDTPGALLALKLLLSGSTDGESLAAAEAGVVWLLDLQNRDGGIPTFCRGWGALPFDRSSPDLTAHTLRAWAAWREEMPDEVRHRIDRGSSRALAFLLREQRPDGSWRPLWFGNQHRRDDEENPTYGTAKVLLALGEIPSARESSGHGAEWLLANQNEDGGWGAACGSTPSTIEETALALSALAFVLRSISPALTRGIAWLERATERGTRFEPSPIGFYFAKLWYYERAYPIVWTVEGLGRLSLIAESAAAESAPHLPRPSKV